MWVSDEIRAAVHQLGVAAGELLDSDTRAVFRRLDARYCRPGNSPIWERLTGASSVQDADGWRRLDRLVAGPIVLLVADSQGVCAFRFRDPTSAVKVLEECSAFEFYVTDDAENYILAFNHHDMVISVGVPIVGFGRRPKDHPQG